jgi:DNA processing protein
LSDGCNLLISQGAGVALDVQDVLERLHRSKASPPLTVNKKAGIDEIPYIVPEPEESLLEPAEEKIEDQILSILDIIPVSASFIMEELYKAGREVSIPELMRILMDMSYNGLIVQNGAYYRKIA